ncbi:sensor histidine kinase [Muricoccus vinaceus]|uniref:histidine kinase n=1 Tax=Muricoccus vinaceus TaxID=424704 RepID=A0ABV6IVH0_9PROT
MPPGRENKRVQVVFGQAPKCTEAASRSAIAEDLQQKLSSVAVRLSAREAELGGIREELRLSLDEARLLAENLEAANTALTRANAELEQRVAGRTAELQAANTALRASEEHMRLVFESATEYAILTLDLGGLVTSWNSGAQRILGYEADDILGQAAAVIFTPEDRAAGVPDLEMCQAAEEGRAQDERWHLRADGSRFWAAGMMMPLLGDEGELRGFLKILRDHTERRHEEERRALLLGELDHRVKNMFATVQAVAAQTLRQAGAPDNLYADFDARLRALSRSHDMLSRGGWEGAPLGEIVERTLEAYAKDGKAGRVSIGGPPILLPPHVAVAVNLALHELATNAAKYGALSASGGRIEVSWELERQAAGEVPVVVVLWRERGGPPVRPPERRGFGSKLLERAMPHEAGGEVTLDFAPDGVECRMRLPLVPPPEKDGTP